jgi:hypothetical protein
MFTRMDADTRKRWRGSGTKGGVVSVSATPQQDGSCRMMKFSGIISSSLSAIEEYDMEHGSLDMNNLQLQVVPEELTELENIRSLILSGNVLSELPPFMYEWSSLVILDISYNAISCLPSTIENWTSLERLDVSHNRLVSLPTSLVKLRSLRELFVDNNEITEVPVELCGCRSLEILSARKNLLGTIPLDLCLCENLHTVSLSGNPLESPFAEYVAMGSSAVVRFLGQMRSRKLSTEQSRRARPFASVVTEGGVKREKEHKEKDISGKKGEKEHKDKDKDKEKEKQHRRNRSQTSGEVQSSVGTLEQDLQRRTVVSQMHTNHLFQLELHPSNATTARGGGGGGSGVAAAATSSGWKASPTTLEVSPARDGATRANRSISELAPMPKSMPPSPMAVDLPLPPQKKTASDEYALQFQPIAALESWQSPKKEEEKDDQATTSRNSAAETKREEAVLQDALWEVQQDNSLLQEQITSILQENDILKSEVISMSEKVEAKSSSHASALTPNSRQANASIFAEWQRELLLWRERAAEQDALVKKMQAQLQQSYLREDELKGRLHQLTQGSPQPRNESVSGAVPSPTVTITPASHAAVAPPVLVPLVSVPGHEDVGRLSRSSSLCSYNLTEDEASESEEHSATVTATASAATASIPVGSSDSVSLHLNVLGSPTPQTKRAPKAAATEQERQPHAPHTHTMLTEPAQLGSAVKSVATEAEGIIPSSPSVPTEGMGMKMKVPVLTQVATVQPELTTPNRQTHRKPAAVISSEALSLHLPSTNNQRPIQPSQPVEATLLATKAAESAMETVSVSMKALEMERDPPGKMVPLSEVGQTTVSSSSSISISLSDGRKRKSPLRRRRFHPEEAHVEKKRHKEDVEAATVAAAAEEPQPQPQPKVSREVLLRKEGKPTKKEQPVLSVSTRKSSPSKIRVRPRIRSPRRQSSPRDHSETERKLPGQEPLSATPPPLLPASPSPGGNPSSTATPPLALLDRLEQEDEAAAAAVQDTATGAVKTKEEESYYARLLRLQAEHDAQQQRLDLSSEQPPQRGDTTTAATATAATTTAAAAVEENLSATSSASMTSYRNPLQASVRSYRSVGGEQPSLTADPPAAVKPAKMLVPPPDFESLKRSLSTPKKKNLQQQPDLPQVRTPPVRVAVSQHSENVTVIETITSGQHTLERLVISTKKPNKAPLPLEASPPKREKDFQNLELTPAKREYLKWEKAHYEMLHPEMPLESPQLRNKLTANSTAKKTTSVRRTKKTKTPLQSQEEVPTFRVRL